MTKVRSKDEPPVSPCSSVAVALGGLTLWHFILISRGETSVERHINRKEGNRLREKGKVDAAPLAPL